MCVFQQMVDNNQVVLIGYQGYEQPNKWGVLTISFFEYILTTDITI